MRIWAHFSKIPETFQACKAIFSYLYLKTEKCIVLKLCMKGISVHTKNIVELNCSVIIRFEILLWLSGCDNCSGPSRNRQVRLFDHAQNCQPNLWERDCFQPIRFERKRPEVRESQTFSSDLARVRAIYQNKDNIRKLPSFHHSKFQLNRTQNS